MEKTNASLSWLEISKICHGSLFGYIVCFYTCDTIKLNVYNGRRLRGTTCNTLILYLQIIAKISFRRSPRID